MSAKITSPLPRPAALPIRRFRSAHWIWLPGEPVPRNAVAEFRHTMRAGSALAGARLLISADSRYTVWLNGRRLGFGPVRNFPRHYQFDVYDLAGLLRRGFNRLAIRVQHWGEGNIQSFVARAGLIAEVQDGDGQVLAATNGNWQARLSPSFRLITPRIACMMPFEEQVTAQSHDWPDGGSGDWSAATVIGSADCEPWGRLTPRDIPLLTDDPWACVGLREAGVATDPPLVLALRAGLILLPDHRSMNIAHPDGLFATVIQVPRAGQLWLKYGAMYSGPVSFVLDGKPLKFQQDEFDLIATRKVSAGSHLLLLDWNGAAHDLDIGIAVGGIAGLRQRPIRRGAAPGWISTTAPGRRRHTLRRASDLTALEASDTVWQSVGAEALPERDIYMSVTSRSVTAGPARKSITLPWSGDPLPIGRSHRLVLDFGRLSNGFIELDLEAGTGTEIDGAGIEGINFGRIQFTELNNNTFSYVCREGRQTFTSHLPRGLRYLVLDVRPRGRAAVVSGARVRVATYPWRPQGSFRCSDTRLNQIYDLCTHTLHMCSMDAFVDATYEQAGWVGDMASMTLQVHHYVQGESLLPDRCLRLAAQSLDRMPLVNSQVPSAWEDRPIPNWSFFWALGVRDHFRFTGDRRFARELLPALEQQARFVERSLNRDGLFAMHGDVWHFLDWNGCESDHRHAATRTYAHENALAIASLQATAQLAATTGHQVAARHWTRLSSTIARAARRAYWLPRAGAFGETRAGGKTSDSVTASTQICALMAGLFRPVDAQAALRRVLAPGDQWLPVGTPWMWSLGARLACDAGYAAAVVPGIRRQWGEMLDRGATTAWEMFEGHHRAGLPTRSWCHGWSAGPAWLLPAYVLGVRPVEPGWRTITLDPQPADLAWAEGTVPTPHGPIRIRWERQPDGTLAIDHEVPRGIRVLTATK